MPYSILLVDDDRQLREELRELLEDYRVIEAGCGEDAVKIIQKPNEVDLVILDVMMPGTRGTQILKQIKEMAPELKIIMLTGHSTKDVAVESLKGRADDYIEKPDGIKRLISSIENLLEAKEKEDIDTRDISGKIALVKRFVQRNWHKKLRLKDAADHVALSPKYLSRVFSEKEDVGFNEYVIKIKIDRSKELLAETANNINQISEKLGYENTESFIRQFKKFTKKTPTQFRLMAKKIRTRK